MPFAAPPAPPPAGTVPPSRPVFSAGSVVARSFSVWFANFVPFSIVTISLHLPVIVLAAFAPPEAGSTSGWRVADLVLSTLAQFVVTGALTYGVLDSLRGGRTPLAALFATGFREAGPVFVTSIRVALWILLGSVLLLVPAVVWYCSLFVAVPAIVVEKSLESSGAALQRSRELTSGSRWAIFMVVLVVFAVTVIVGAVAGFLGALAVSVPPSLTVTVQTAIAALLSSFGACASAVAYHDLRIVREGVAPADLVKVFE